MIRHKSFVVNEFNFCDVWPLELWFSFLPISSYVGRTVKRNPLLFAIFLLLMPCLRAQAPHAAPMVNKVEPPNWFVGLPNPMLLVYGENLTDAQVKSASLGVKVERVDVESTGHYAFVWLDTTAAHAGAVKLTLSNAQGSVAVPFAMSARRAQSVAQALSVDDVIARVDLAQIHADSNDHATGVWNVVARRLDALKELGATAVSTTAIYRGISAHGAPDDFYAPDGQLGAIPDYQKLVESAHVRGLRVFLDLEMNHVAVEHAWAAQPPARNWFHGTSDHHLAATSGVIAALTDPHAPVAQQKAETEGWVDNKFPDLNQESSRVSQYLIQNAIWWTETIGLDGLRLENMPMIDREFWREFEKDIRKLYPQLTTIGIVADADPGVNAFFAGGVTRFDGIDTGVDTLLDTPLSRGISAVDAGEPLRTVPQLLSKDWMYPSADKLVTDWKTPNANAASGSAQNVALAPLLFATLRGIPEFNADGVIVANQASQAAFAQIRNLLQMRKDHYALRQGKLYNIAVDENTYAYARIYAGTGSGFQRTKDENLLIVVNTSDQPKKLSLDLRDTPLALAQALHDVQPGISAKLGAGSIEVEVAPKSMAIYAIDCGCELP